MGMTLGDRRIESKYAWLVAVSNCWINFSIYALYRSYGVLFVAFKDVYSVGHQTAAWPFTLFCSIYHLVGPIVGHLSHFYSLRSLQMTGCIFASIGVISCTFVSSFTGIIVLLGIVQGLGLGVLRTLSNVIIQMYFKENRATATGIAMAGGTISSFFFPPFAEYLFLNHGLNSCYLVFGFLMLQAIVPLLLQTPPVDLKSQSNNNSSMATSSTDDESHDKFNSNRIHHSLDDHQLGHETKNPSSMLLASGKNITNDFEASTGSHFERPPSSTLQTVLLLSRTPIFWVISLTFVTYNITLQIFLMTIVDITLEKGITDKITAVYLIPVFSVADLIGRVSFGWISDKGFLRTKTISVICHLILTLCMTLTPISSTFAAMAVFSFTTGLMIGILTILWPLLNVDYFGTRTLPFVLGMNCFLSGSESVFRPFVIGYFLDTIGRYDLLYYSVASSLLITTVLWLMEPWIHLKSSDAFARLSLQSVK